MIAAGLMAVAEMELMDLLKLTELMNAVE